MSEENPQQERVENIVIVNSEFELRSGENRLPLT